MNLIASGLLFLGGLTLDGSTVGFAYRDVRYEYEIMYTVAASKDYGVGNPMSLGVRPQAMILRPLAGEYARLSYRYLVVRSMAHSGGQFEVSAGLNSKLGWYPMPKWSGGPSLAVTLWTSKEDNASGLRLLVDMQAAGTRRPFIDVVFMFAVSLSWDAAPEMPED